METAVITTDAVDVTFHEWRDRIAWGAVAGGILIALSWAAWITDRSYQTPTAADVRELRISIHALDKAVDRLTTKIETTTESRIKP